MRRLSPAVVAAALLALAGCQRVNYEATYDLNDEVSYREAEFDPPRGDQKLQVKATSDKEPVNVYVALAEDKEAIIPFLKRKRTPPKVLGSQENSKDISFEVTVPAKKAFIVFTNTGRDDALSVQQHREVAARRQSGGTGLVTKVKLTVKGH